VIDWAGAVITPADTIATATAEVINGFMSSLLFRPLRSNYRRSSTFLKGEFVEARLRATLGVRSSARIRVPCFARSVDADGDPIRTKVNLFLDVFQLLDCEGLP
jgi:hypothetical protein